MQTVHGKPIQGCRSGVDNPQAALAWARSRGAGKLVRHATAAGRALYAKAGFLASTAYMELAH